MATRKTIKLGFVRHLKDNDYVVQEVTNSTEFNPGQVLTENQVSALCNNPRWSVRIVPHKAVA